MDLAQYIRLSIDEELRAIEEMLPMGGCKDMASYAETCGIYKGLLKAKGILIEIIERSNKDDDLD